MQIILDNIASTFIAGAVLLILMSTNHQAQVTAVEVTSYHILNKSITGLMSVIKRDMQNVSSVVTASEVDSSFSFYARVSDTDTTTRLVDYRRQLASTVSDDNGEYSLYKIVRLVDGKVTGGSLATISDWSIEGLTDSGAKATDPADVSAISVSVKAVPPIAPRGTALEHQPDAQWQTVFKPRLLRDTKI